MVYDYQYKRFKYSTGEKIDPKFWNKKNHRAKETRKFPQYPEFNARLQKTGIVYHLRRVKVSHPRRTKVSIVGRMNVSH